MISLCIQESLEGARQRLPSTSASPSLSPSASLVLLQCASSTTGAGRFSRRHHTRARILIEAVFRQE
ncbi:uncharacterized protein LOC143372005 isoform X2 [Andrena cerasifolii]|uniref:uncharacterized protein LOC143372005 isoform X2 n=1 Tax=Andrena cerasifolii TaxID=2819439 RepID=UPI0040379BAC